ncbi:MAG: MtnX-like HAD-IB family phosphatase [Candidatus Heimdallarchaeota archaeon]
MRIAICCDFDGTITLIDTGKALLTKLSEKDWQYYDELVIKGEIGTREALVHQWGTIDYTTNEEIMEIVDKIEVDPTFKEFHEWVRKNDLKFIVVSDGFVSYIKRILENHNFHSEIEIRANDMELLENKIQLNFLTPNCEHDCANCKYEHVKNLKDEGFKIIYIGDGLSDIFPAQNLADIIFAKKNEDLAKALEDDSRLNIFSNFSEIISKIEAFEII